MGSVVDDVVQRPPRSRLQLRSADLLPTYAGQDLRLDASVHHVVAQGEPGRVELGDLAERDHGESTVRGRQPERTERLPRAQPGPGTLRRRPDQEQTVGALDRSVR